MSNYLLSLFMIAIPWMPWFQVRRWLRRENPGRDAAAVGAHHHHHHHRHPEPGVSPVQSPAEHLGDPEVAEPPYGGANDKGNKGGTGDNNISPNKISNISTDDLPSTVIKDIQDIFNEICLKLGPDNTQGGASLLSDENHSRFLAIEKAYKEWTVESGFANKVPNEKQLVLVGNDLLREATILEQQLFDMKTYVHGNKPYRFIGEFRTLEGRVNGLRAFTRAADT